MKKALACLVILLTLCQPTYGWSERGHHIIALLAFKKLDAATRGKYLALLQAHPDYSRIAAYDGQLDFLRDQTIGKAAYWPDVARSSAEWNRPTWHYQLGATEVIGRVDGVPDFPGALPADANLRTQELYIQQAVELCVATLKEPDSEPSDKALALSWLLHLIADGHQPCHAGSLYVEKVFPEGDRGANSIQVEQGGNLHALWDGLLGRSFDRSKIYAEIQALREESERLSASGLDLGGAESIYSGRWLEESRRAAQKYVYDWKLRIKISSAQRTGAPSLEKLDLPEVYLEDAGKVARTRAMLAGIRLAAVLNDCAAAWKSTP